MKMIVGLGNPGPQYRQTRHNVGFMLIDELAEKSGIAVEQAKFKALIGEGRYAGERIVLLKPMTYMNLSGEAVKAAANWYKININDILIVYDDMDLDVGKMRFRRQGSAGGHNGMKSIISHFATEEFARLKIGIGRPVVKDVVGHVLTKFMPEEQTLIDEQIAKGILGINLFIETGDILQVMNKYNG